MQRTMLFHLALLPFVCGAVDAAQPKPNILVWGDDIGVHNISAYNHGIMGYKTPSIDRLAGEGEALKQLEQLRTINAPTN